MTFTTMNSLKALVNYLGGHGACGDAVDAARDVWKEYKNLPRNVFTRKYR